MSGREVHTIIGYDVQTAEREADEIKGRKSGASASQLKDCHYIIGYKSGWPNAFIALRS